MADLVLIAVLVICAIWGCKRGFAKTLVGLMSTFLSLVLTTLLYPPISNIIYDAGLGNAVKEYFLKLISGDGDGMISVPTVAEATAATASVIVVNVISFLLVVILVKLLFIVLLKSLNLIAKLPVLKQANSLLGLCVGIVSGLLLSYVAVGVIAALSANGIITASWMESIVNSNFASLMCEGNLVANILSKIIS